MLVVPAPSAFSLAAARLGWALPDTVLVSLHGRALDLVRPHLQPGARVLALTSDGDGPAALARLLTQIGLRRLALDRAGGAGRPARARPRVARPASTSAPSKRSTWSRSRLRRPDARVLARGPALPDPLRARRPDHQARSARGDACPPLAPRRGELLWDIGAGSGSVAIEWMLADPTLRAVAVERRAERAARIRRNAAAFGVPALEIVEGAAPSALAGLAAPDAIFIGGGASAPGVLDARCAALRSGGRLVVNAVTLETEALLHRSPCRAGRRTDPHRDRPRRPLSAKQPAGAGAAGDAIGSGAKNHDRRRRRLPAWRSRRPTIGGGHPRCARHSAGIAAEALGAVATIAAKASETGIKAAAESLGVAMIVVADVDVQAVSGRTQTRSERVFALTGMPSVAEAAALAAGGPQARLLGPRLVVGAATCALATCALAACEATPCKDGP